MRENKLPRAISKEPTTCTRCGDLIEANEIFAVYYGQPYCECCVEDYEEEGRPL